MEGCTLCGAFILELFSASLAQQLLLFISLVLPAEYWRFLLAPWFPRLAGQLVAVFAARQHELRCRRRILRPSAVDLDVEAADAGVAGAAHQLLRPL